MKRSGLAAAAALLLALLSVAPAANAAPVANHAVETDAAISNDADGATILGAWQAAGGWLMHVRAGTYDADLDQGFGMTKIIAKHGITHWHSLRYITQNPTSGESQGNQSTHHAYANMLECDLLEDWCEVVDSIMVRTVMDDSYVDDYYGVPVNGILGIITAYCLDYVYCPAWVNTALENADDGGGLGARAASGSDVTVTARTYEPLPVGTVLTTAEAASLGVTDE